MREEHEAAFDEFAATAMPGLRRLALAWCRDGHRADDLVQDALERVYAAWPRVRRDGEPFAYARTTMLRRMISEGRRPWRRCEVVGLEPEVHDPLVEPDPALGLDLLAALAALPPRQRAVFLLRHVEDLGVAETAEVLRCSEGTVKSQTSHARAALRAHLGAAYAGRWAGDPAAGTPTTSSPTAGSGTGGRR
ncbi:SigE family RNA polymerase sigma factor [Kineococcus glutinatus]|uniref:RNA polymerase sigma factor n=1 Tax=Kineococcus glutinatus TaxID=1070872 RepID=UPI0031EFCF4C